MKGISIVKRVNLPGLVAITITALILLGVVPDRQREDLMQRVQAELEATALAGSRSIVAGLDLERLDLLSDVNEFINSANSVSAAGVYLTEDGEKQLFAVYPQSYADDFEAVLMQKEFISATVGFAGEGFEGEITTVYERRKFEKSLAVLNYPIYAVFLTLMVTQLLLFFIVNRWVIRPVQRAIDAASALNEETGLVISAEQSQSNEMNLLEQTLAALGRNLRERNTENAQILENLELMVDERTEDLTKALAAKNEFIGSISHELRTPLHSINASLHLIGLESNDKNPEIQELSAIANQASSTLLDLIDQLLAFQKIEYQGVVLKPETFLLEDLVSKATRLGEILFRDSDVSFVVKATGDLAVTVVGDHRSISQVLSNLINNAYKYTKEGEVRVIFEAELDGDRLRFHASVEDTGIGMSTAHIDTIGEPFSREERTLNSEIMGAGLGLSIVTSILKAWGTKLEFESELDKGSRFAFEVNFFEARKTSADVVRLNRTIDNKPISKSTKVQDQRIEQSQARELASKDQALKILYVEDTPLNRAIMEAMLRKVDGPVECVMEVNAEKGFKKIREDRFDLVVTDIKMPGASGLELLKWIKSEHDPDLPVIALTATADPVSTSAYKAAGFNSVLTKPLSLDELRETLNEFRA